MSVPDKWPDLPPFPEITNSHMYKKSYFLYFCFPIGENQAMMGKDVN